MSTKTDSTTKFQFLEACLIVNPIRPNPTYLRTHNTTLAKGGFASYNPTRIELKSFIFSAEPKSMFFYYTVFVSCRNVYYSYWLITSILLIR